MQRIICALALWMPVMCSAQLSGQFHYPFTNRPALWDFSGSYTGATAIIQIEHALVHAPSGALNGTGKVHYDDGINRFDAVESESGRVAAAASRVRMSMAGSGQFTGRALGQAISGTFSGKSVLSLDPTNRSIAGSESGTICVPLRGCRTLTTNMSYQLSADIDGTWVLALDVATSNKVVRGTATVELSNGRTVAFTVRGRYLLTTATSRLTLNGLGNARGIVLSVKTGAENRLQSLRGSLFGQRLVYP